MRVKHDAVVVLIDAGCSMADELETAKGVVDWIVSRKVRGERGYGRL